MINQKFKFIIYKIFCQLLNVIQRRCFYNLMNRKITNEKLKMLKFVLDLRLAGINIVSTYQA